jgi:hypothetical protein
MPLIVLAELPNISIVAETFTKARIAISTTIRRGESYWINPQRDPDDDNRMMGLKPNIEVCQGIV